MTTKKEELLKRFKEERIAREKARIQMLHDMNRKKYSKLDENAWKYSKSNTSLNISNKKSSVKNAAYKNKRAKLHKNYSLISFSEDYLNVSAPVCSNESLSSDLNPKRRSVHSSSAEQNEPTEYSSPTSKMDVK